MIYYTFSLRRSGTHAVANWILSQLDGAVLYFHNFMLSPGGYPAPTQVMYCLPYQDRVLPLGIPVLFSDRMTPHAHQVDHPLSHVVPFKFSSPFDLGPPLQEGETFFGGTLPKIEHRYYGFENVTAKEALSTSLLDHIDVDRSKFIVWVRDPLDNLASLWARAANEPKHLPGPYPSSHLLPTNRFASMWCQQAKEFLTIREDKEGLEVLAVTYEEWASSREVRARLAESLGLTFTDAGFDSVCKAGGGSSFDGKHADPKTVRSRSKGREMYRQDAAFKEYMDKIGIPAMKDLYASIYGTPLSETLGE
jgi:hypothetical protein